MGREHHGTNCAYRADPDEPCTCGVTERTEREMHAAWRKRAEEAETALAAMTAERDESGRRLGEFQLRLAGALIASEGGNGCPDGAIECIRTCPTIASVMRLRAERDELRKACQAALDTFMGIRVGGVIATEIMLRSALARAAVEGER